MEGSVRLEATTSLWEASATIAGGPNQLRRVHIRQDSLVWETKEARK